jgi:putative aldouronate transport system permease protein
MKIMKKQFIKKHKHSVSGSIFDICNIVFNIILCVSILFPLFYLLTLSISRADDISLTSIFILPKRIAFDNYLTMFRYKYMRTGILRSVLRTLLGTGISLVLFPLTAYPLSKRNLLFRTPILGFMVLTMFLQGGIIPNYIIIKNLGLIDTIWALVLPGAVVTFWMLIMRNYFMALPEALEEAAKIEGAGHLTILFKIILPCSLPIIATVALWAIVGHWNSWFDSMIYMRTPEKQVLQVVMRNIVQSQRAASSRGSGAATTLGGLSAVTPQTLQAAAIMITMLPILCTYPFLQKYFVKGILVGSLKG